MQLYASTTSPYARKVRITIAQKRLGDAVEIIWASPFEDSPNSQRLRSVNPLNKIPTLVLSDGQIVFDSRVICELLDDIGQGPRLLSTDPLKRARQRSTMALADGILDAAFSLTMEGRKPPQQQSAEWIARWSTAIGSAIASIDWGNHEGWGLPEIGLVCALDYVTFRQPHLYVPSPAAALWHARASEQLGVAATLPQ